LSRTSPDRFASKRGRTVTETDLVAYSGLSGDYSSLHTDAEWAKAGPFGARIAHGCLTLSFATGLEFALIGDDQGQAARLLRHGPRPLREACFYRRHQLEGEVIGLDDKDDKRGVLTMQQEIKNQRGETCVALQKRLLMKKRAYDG